jgi:hypothetical protein
MHVSELCLNFWKPIKIFWCTPLLGTHGITGCISICNPLVTIISLMQHALADITRRTVCSSFKQSCISPDHPVTLCSEIWTAINMLTQGIDAPLMPTVAPGEFITVGTSHPNVWSDRARGASYHLSCKTEVVDYVQFKNLGIAWWSLQHSKNDCNAQCIPWPPRPILCGLWLRAFATVCRYWLSVHEEAKPNAVHKKQTSNTTWTRNPAEWRSMEVWLINQVTPVLAQNGT